MASSIESFGNAVQDFFGELKESGPRASVAALESAGQVIEFNNPRGLFAPIKFPAFLTAFTDQLTANFNEKTTYGRMDPIYTYQNTVRAINFSVDIPAVGPTEAKNNLIKVKRLQTLLYPTYSNEEGSSALIISTAPLFQIKFNNLISDPDASGGYLMGVIPSINFQPSMDPGMFYQDGQFFPKLIKLDVEFKPLHSGVSGFKQGSQDFLRSVPNADVGAASPPAGGSGAPAPTASDGVQTPEGEVAGANTDNAMGIS